MSANISALLDQTMFDIEYNTNYMDKTTRGVQNSPKSFETIDSILSLDDTILTGLNFYNNKPGNEHTKNKVNIGINTNHDKHKTMDFDNEFETTSADTNLEAVIDNDVDDNFVLTTAAFQKENIQRHDSSLLNNTFTQLHFTCDQHKSSNENILESIIGFHNASIDFTQTVVKESTPENEEHLSLTHTDNLEKYLISDEEDINFSQIDFINNSIESENVGHVTNISKREALLFEDPLPCKKLHSTSESRKRTTESGINQNSTFYGLPNNVWNLIQKIKGITKLYQWQDECLRLDAIEKRKNLIYALPTSGGKTLVAEILMLREMICNKKNAIFILPFVALVQEKVQSLAPFALELGFLVEEYAGFKGQYPPKKRRRKNSIYICTIEKALGLTNSLLETRRLQEIGIIVVDELHLLGEDGGRGATLEGLLTKIMYTSENIHIVGMSATIGNLNEIVQFLKADIYTQNFRPVEIKEYIKCESDIWLLDVRNEELLTDKKKINYRYSHEANKLDPDRIGGLVMDVVPKDSCLIFCSSRKNCENVALLLTEVLLRSLEDHKKIEKQNLLNALKTEEGLCPVLKKTITFGIAYHHSGLTAQERKLLEDAFRDGTLCVICCTSTLAAGVNLPARRVILRSPYVGNQFISLSRYKQMVGRAGRAGMGDLGESIIICRANELQQVKEMLTSKMDDSISSLHSQADRGINNLVLSSIFLSLANTRYSLQELVSTTLLYIQRDSLKVNVKKLTDDTISSLLKYGVIKVKDNKVFDVVKPDITICVPSQDQNLNNPPKSVHVKQKKTVILTDNTEIELCDLGRAAMKGNIELQYAFILYQDLKAAQKHLVLLDCLHLLYLVTPYDLISQVKPMGSVYYDEVTHFTDSQMETARLLGINEATVRKIRDGMMPKTVDVRVINRFYVTLILHDLWNQYPVYAVAEKYQINRGIIQNFFNSVSSFSASVVRFCQELDEFWAFRDVLDTFSKKLCYCCPSELEMLMELPSVKIGRARQLYNAGYKTLQDIAKADPKDLQEKIKYLNQKVITQIITAANLLIVEKVENLRDEADAVLAGMDISQFTMNH